MKSKTQKSPFNLKNKKIYGKFAIIFNNIEHHGAMNVRVTYVNGLK